MLYQDKTKINMLLVYQFNSKINVQMILNILISIKLFFNIGIRQNSVEVKDGFHHKYIVHLIS
jgi:hypothetical protein